MIKLLLILIALLFPHFQAEEKYSEEDFPSKDELLGKINPENHPDFVQVDPSISYFPEVYLRKNTYKAFLDMREAALRQDINLTVKSGTRTFYIQRYLWNRKFTGQRPTGNERIDQSLPDSSKTAIVLKYSAMPGTSRHHWGTEIDINSTSHAYFQNGEGKKVYDWLKNNAADFGFYQVYIPFGEKRSKGFQAEEWHWTYKPESDVFTYAFKKLISGEDIRGFHGDEFVDDFNVIEHYVYGINPELLE
ncbi:MAG: M15 family metallopeptidase [Bacteroidales bacterium]